SISRIEVADACHDVKTFSETCERKLGAMRSPAQDADLPGDKLSTCCRIVVAFDPARRILEDKNARWRAERDQGQRIPGRSRPIGRARADRERSPRPRRAGSGSGSRTG